MKGKSEFFPFPVIGRRLPALAHPFITQNQLTTRELSGGKTKTLVIHKLQCSCPCSYNPLCLIISNSSHVIKFLVFPSPVALYFSSPKLPWESPTLCVCISPLLITSQHVPSIVRKHFTSNVFHLGLFTPFKLFDSSNK